MLLEEAQARLKKTTITQENLWQINSLYILLDLHKDDFCKFIDIVGLDKLIAKQEWYERLDRAEKELSAKERYLNAKSRLKELESEKASLEQYINEYRPLDRAG